MLPYGWTRGEPILRLNLRTRTIDQRIVTEDNKQERSCSAYGLALAGDWLYVAHDWLTISKVDRTSGQVVARLHVEDERYGLIALGAMEHDGTHLVALGLARRPGNASAPVQGVAIIEPESGRVVDFKVLDFPVQGLALQGGDYLTSDRELFDICRPGWSRKPERMRVHVFWP